MNCNSRFSLMLACALVLLGCSEKERPPGPVDAADGRLRFSDETAARGLAFRHQSGMTGKRYMHEQLGSGAALFDCDADGDLDILFLNGGPIKGSPAPKKNVLYLNNGTGFFQKADGDRGIAAGEDYCVGCAVADVDLDGDLDVFISCYGLDKLYLNDGRGRFEYARESGITSDLWGASCAFGDVNGDGLPDLYVTNYVQYDIEKHEPCYQRDIEVYCGPQPFLGQRDFLWINQGGGRFNDGTIEAFGSLPDGKGLGVAMADYDHDGDLDIYVANDQTPNFLFKNRGDGSFESLGDLAGVHVSRDGKTEAGMGVAFADYDNDGLEDIVVTNFEDQVNSVYRNEGDDFFLEVAWQTGIGYASRPYLGWGVGLIDFDSDGFKDIFFGNGHVYDNASEINDSTSWGQKNRLHMNTGNGEFERAESAGGKALDMESVTRGVAFGDVDNDGDVDILVLNVEDAPQLLINQGPGGNWLLVGTRHPKAGSPVLGARIEIAVGKKKQVQTVQGGYSFLTHNDTRVHFGLAAATGIDSLSVTWVGGETQSYGSIPSDKLVIVCPDGTALIKNLKTGKIESELKAK